MNSDTTNKLLLGCFALCLVTMISSLYTSNNSSSDESVNECNKSLSLMRDELGAITKTLRSITNDIISLKYSVDNPIIYKSSDSKLNNQVLSISSDLQNTYQLVFGSHEQIMGPISIGGLSSSGREYSMRQLLLKITTKLDRISTEVVGDEQVGAPWGSAPNNSISKKVDAIYKALQR